MIPRGLKKIICPTAWSWSPHISIYLWAYEVSQESFRQVWTGRTDEQRLAFTGLLSEPKTTFHISTIKYFRRLLPRDSWQPRAPDFQDEAPPCPQEAQHPLSNYGRYEDHEHLDRLNWRLDIFWICWIFFLIFFDLHWGREIVESGKWKLLNLMFFSFLYF